MAKSRSGRKVVVLHIGRYRGAGDTLVRAEFYRINSRKVVFTVIPSPRLQTIKFG